VARPVSSGVASVDVRNLLVKFLALGFAVLVAFWCGTAFQAANTAPHVVYIQKSDAPRCELIDRFRKRKEAHL
jgi:hypothetical protein